MAEPGVTEVGVVTDALMPEAPVAPAPDFGAMRAELDAQAAQLARGQAELDILTQTLTQVLATQRAAPVPEPQGPAPEEFDSDPIGASARVADARVRQSMKALGDQLTPVLQNLGERTYQMEREQVRGTDPRNFKRLETRIDDYFRSYPAEKLRANAVRDVFYRLRGEHMPELIRMDAADRAATPTVAEPNAPSATPKAPAAPQRPAIGEKEQRIIRGLGLTEAAYLKSRYGWEEPVNGKK